MNRVVVNLEPMRDPEKRRDLPIALVLALPKPDLPLIWNEH